MGRQSHNHARRFDVTPNKANGGGLQALGEPARHVTRETHFGENLWRDFAYSSGAAGEQSQSAAFVLLRSIEHVSGNAGRIFGIATRNGRPGAGQCSCIAG